MMAKRRNPNPPRASSKINSPASSGPRCVITSRIETSSSRRIFPAAAPYSQTPQMPHIKRDVRDQISDVTGQTSDCFGLLPIQHRNFLYQHGNLLPLSARNDASSFVARLSSSFAGKGINAQHFRSGTVPRSNQQTMVDGSFAP